MSHERFPEMVGIYLAAKRISQKTAAKEIGINESTLSRFLTGNGKPDFDANMKIIAWIFFN